MDDSDALRVVIAEDNYLVREGLRRLLEDSGEIDVVASTGNATELVDAVRRLSPHAVLTVSRLKHKRCRGFPIGFGAMGLGDPCSG